jgi:ketosteroid isomerase-like protein
VSEQRAPAEGAGSIRGAASLALADRKERIVRRMLDALARGDSAAIGELLTDDVFCYVPGRSSVAGTYHGRAEVLEFVDAFVELFDEPPAFDSHDVVASEAHVLDLATYTASRNGQSFAWNTVRLYHVDDDRISEIWLMIGDIYAFDSFLGVG